MNTRVFVRAVRREASDVAAAIEGGLISASAPIRSGDRLAVKLNLTYPKYLPGVVNSPVFVEGLCLWAKDRGVRLQLLEGDGGNGSYSAWDTFRGNGVDGIAQRYGAECISLSESPWHWRTTHVAGEDVKLPYSPFFERREFDRFAVAPLFKNHVYTVATLGMKNLWGCIPDPYRMYYHHVLDRGIVALYEELRPDFSIFDGLVALRGRGPMDGQPLDWNIVMVSGSVGAGERAALDLMGINVRRVRHIAIAHSAGHVPRRGQIQWSGDPAQFRRNDFILDRSVFNHLSIALSRHPRLMRWVYHSPASKAVYAVVNAIRGVSPQADLVRAKQNGVYETRRLEKRGATAR